MPKFPGTFFFLSLLTTFFLFIVIHMSLDKIKDRDSKTNRLVQSANLNIRVADYFLAQSMKIVLLVYNMVFYNIRRSAHLSESLGPPGGPPKEKRN